MNRYVVGQPTRQLQENHDQKRKNALIVILVQMVLSVVGFSIGLRVYLMTDNEKAGAFWPHVTLAFGSLFLLIGVCLKHAGRGWMVAGTVFCAIGIILAFVGTIVDGVQGGHVQGTEFSQCEYSASGGTSHCSSDSSLSWDSSCQMSYPPRSCYCCYIFRDHNCDGWGFSLSTQPNLYEGVSSCRQVETTYKNLVWTSMIFNVINIVMSIMACAMVSAYKQSLRYVHPAVASYPSQVPIIMPPAYGIPPTVPTVPAMGPVVFFTQQQSVGYLPAGVPHNVQPPAYSPLPVAQPLPSRTANCQASSRNALGSRHPEPSAPPQSTSMADGETTPQVPIGQPKPSVSRQPDSSDPRHPRERDLISPPPPYVP